MKKILLLLGLVLIGLMSVGMVNAATLVGHKVMCDKEACLPNWGSVSGGGPHITSTTAQDYVQNIAVNSGLAGHWELDEASGATVAADSSGNNNDGTIYGATPGQTGMINGAYLFDGADDYINCGNDASIKDLNDFSISMWIKTDTTSTQGSNNPSNWWRGQWIIDKDKAGQAKGYALTNHHHKLKFYVNNNGQTLVSKSNIDDNQWHHVTVVRDGGRRYLYIDGELDSWSKGKNTAGVSHNDNLLIGKNSGAAGTRFDGYLDDVRIYNRVLTPPEVAVLAGKQCGGCALEDGWQFQWKPGNNPGDPYNPNEDNANLLGAPWTTFGPTNTNGQVSTTFNTAFIWVREALQPGYLQFSHVGGSDVSAEMHCYNDVHNYDNFDYIGGATDEGTYYCVAFNVCKDEDGDGLSETDNPVCGPLDICPNSVPDNIELNPNNYAQNDDFGAFEVNPAEDQSIVYDMGVSEGCTCTQIVAALEAGAGHLKKGCSPSIMEEWTGVSANPDRIEYNPQGGNAGGKGKATGAAITELVSETTWLGLISIAAIIALAVVSLTAFNKLKK